MSKVFKLQFQKSSSEKIDSFYKKAMEELSEFYQLNWNRNTPFIYLVDSREDYDKLNGFKTEPWVIASAFENGVLMLSPESYEKESIHKYSDDEYFSLIKHEFSHLFYNIFAKNNYPVWLNEGFAIYSSGQLATKKRPKKLSKFLNYYSQGGADVYEESGFVVEGLIKKFGKEKVLKFIKLLPNVRGERVFKETFEKFFDLELSYESIQELL
ncbi:MAG: hypothetical protein ACOX06_02455 [Candidatus Dojkabacteria bacterium]|jgi:hypothetical protein